MWGLSCSQTFWFFRYKIPRFCGKTSNRRLCPVYMYICHLNLIEKLRILGRYYGNTLKDEDLKICIPPRHVLKAKTAKFQAKILFRRWFSRYPIFKVFTNMYNSAGEFSTHLKTVITEHISWLSIEQWASPTVQWSRRASPSSSRGLRPREEEELIPRSRLPALWCDMQQRSVLREISYQDETNQ